MKAPSCRVPAVMGSPGEALGVQHPSSLPWWCQLCSYFAKQSRRDMLRALLGLVWYPTAAGGCAGTSQGWEPWLLACFQEQQLQV